MWDQIAVVLESDRTEGGTLLGPSVFIVFMGRLTVGKSGVYEKCVNRSFISFVRSFGFIAEKFHLDLGFQIHGCIFNKKTIYQNA